MFYYLHFDLQPVMNSFSPPFDLNITIVFLFILSNSGLAVGWLGAGYGLAVDQRWVLTVGWQWAGWVLAVGLQAVENHGIGLEVAVTDRSV